MKKLFFVLVSLVLLTGCDNRTEEQRYQDYLNGQKQEQLRKEREERFKDFEVIVIDSCEYLIKKEYHCTGKRGYGFGYMSHKGNCRFCQERNNK